MGTTRKIGRFSCACLPRLPDEIPIHQKERFVCLFGYGDKSKTNLAVPRGIRRGRRGSLFPDSDGFVAATGSEDEGGSGGTGRGIP